MVVAQGIVKTLAYKAQSALGTPASGGSGSLLRRVTSNFTFETDTFENNEIVSHQQSTGITYGGKKVNGTINGLLSAGTYKDLFANLLRGNFAATSAITGLTLSIAGSGPYTITRSAGDFLTGGIKIGDVVRITAGTYTGTARDINLLCTNVTATVLTVIVLNGSALTTQSSVASSTVTVVGKKSLPPTSSHTNVYLGFEEYYSDLTRSEMFNDCKVARAEIGLPSSGNATVNFGVVGLNRVQSGSQVLTSPTAESTSTVLTAVNGLLVVNGSAVTSITGATLTIDGGVTHGDMVVGSNVSPDLDRGRIKVSGQFTALFDSNTISALYQAETPTSLVLVMTDDETADADFVTFSMSRIKLTGDAPDDGEKQIIRTFPFTAEINGAGGASLANGQTIITVQDSLA